MAKDDDKVAVESIELQLLIIVIRSQDKQSRTSAVRGGLEEVKKLMVFGVYLKLGRWVGRVKVERMEQVSKLERGRNVQNPVPAPTMRGGG